MEAAGQNEGTSDKKDTGDNYLFHSLINKPKRMSELSILSNLVDFGGDDEVVLVKAADFMGKEFDFHLALMVKVKIGVVAFLFGDSADSVNEDERLFKIFKGELFGDFVRIGFENPTSYLSQVVIDFIGR